MNRRGVAAAVLGVLALVTLGLAWGGAASGTPEPIDSFTTLDVNPSDNLPISSSVKVDGVGFFIETTGPTTATVRQCVPSIGGCGGPTSYPVAGGTFSGDFVAVRMLTLSDTTVDCTTVTCELQASDGLNSAAHHLTFSTITSTVPPVVVPTTTLLPPTTVSTPTTTPSTVRSTPTSAPTTVPVSTTAGKTAKTTVPVTTKVVHPTSTSSTVPATTTTAAPTTTTTVVPAPPGDKGGPTLIAVTPKNQPAGPPGGGLHVEGTGYTCSTVYFFFDGIRVGSAPADATGTVERNGLSVPGDAHAGKHKITSSCQSSGDVVEKASSFDVIPVAVHRPAFVTSLPLPGDIALNPSALLASAALALGAIALVAFPFELFNSTMEENYDEIRAWFRLGPRGVDETTTRSRTLSFFALTAVSALACGFLSPDFGFNRTSLVLFVGMFVAMLVMAVVFSLPADLGIHREFGEWGKLNFLPGSVVVSILMVVASRLLHFQPGYFYGALAGLAFRSALSEGVQGRMTAANWLFSLVVSAGAWFARVPVSHAAARAGSNIWWIGLEICLALIFLWGVEGLAVAMLPLRFLDGRKVLRWNRVAWAALFFLGLFATFEILLAPGSGYVGQTSTGVKIAVMVLYASFGLGSVAFWAYFRYRPQRWAVAGT
jgi:hypothetical protein